MKNVFAYRNQTPDGNVFVTRSAQGGLANKKKKLDEEALCLQKSFSTPKWIEPFLLIVFALWLLVVVTVTFFSEKEMLARKTSIIIQCVCLGVGFLCVFAVAIINISKKERVLKSKSFTMFGDELQKLMREVKESLAIPSDAVKCDVFSCRYLPKKNRQKRMPFFKNSYLSLETEMWREGEAFCAFDGDAVFKFPFESVIETERVEKRITFYGWNKPEKHNRGKYKLYKVRYNSNGEYYTVKPVYRVRLFRESEEYEILIPAYEKETLEKLTGKTLT